MCTVFGMTFFSFNYGFLIISFTILLIIINAANTTLGCNNNSNINKCKPLANNKNISEFVVKFGEVLGRQTTLTFFNRNDKNNNSQLGSISMLMMREFLVPSKHLLIQTLYENDHFLQCQMIRTSDNDRNGVHLWNVNNNNGNPENFVLKEKVEYDPNVKWLLTNYTEEMDKCTNSRRRKKRGLFNFLLIPGTNWCGVGTVAETYTHLGRFQGADKCCRQHDTKCRYSIGSGKTKYGLTNWGLGTMMHCSCDERFRTCLKWQQTTEANFVGRLFFNFLGSPCFTFRNKTKMCRKVHRKPGKCRRRATKIHAIKQKNQWY